jgi:hypothetical protein
MIEAVDSTNKSNPFSAANSSTCLINALARPPRRLKGLTDIRLSVGDENVNRDGDSYEWMVQWGVVREGGRNGKGGGKWWGGENGPPQLAATMADVLHTNAAYYLSTVFVIGHHPKMASSKVHLVNVGQIAGGHF